MKKCLVCDGTGIKSDSTRSIGSVIICSCQTWGPEVRSRIDITKYTPAVLRAVCKQQGISKKKYRLATLKLVEYELAHFLTSSSLSNADRDTLAELHRAVRLALGDE